MRPETLRGYARPDPVAVATRLPSPHLGLGAPAHPQVRNPQDHSPVNQPVSLESGDTRQVTDLLLQMRGDDHRWCRCMAAAPGLSGAFAA